LGTVAVLAAVATLPATAGEPLAGRAQRTAQLLSHGAERARQPFTRSLEAASDAVEPAADLIAVAAPLVVSATACTPAAVPARACAGAKAAAGARLGAGRVAWVATEAVIATVTSRGLRPAAMLAVSVAAPAALRSGAAGVPARALVVLATVPSAIWVLLAAALAGIARATSWPVVPARLLRVPALLAGVLLAGTPASLLSAS
jgi:hypothetical protein